MPRDKALAKLRSQRYYSSEKGESVSKLYANKYYRADPVKAAFGRGISQARFKGYAPPDITLDKYREVVDSQKYCEICGREAQRLCLDHCHETGVFRGMLCRSCNTALGLMGDNPDLLIEAACYLNRYRSGAN